MSHHTELTAEKREERRASLERVVERLKSTQRFRLSRHCQPNWSTEELKVIVLFADKIANDEISYYASCTEIRKILPNRTWEAIRSKLKNYVNYGEFKH
jgi:hypothetical protein